MKRSNLIYSLLALFFMMSCSEWEEPQLDNELVEVLAPRDSLQTNVVSQLFYWFEVSDAIEYELQIVSPTFASIDRLVLDTVTASNKFEYTLTPGDYEWSVRALNNSSSTAYTVHRLYIDSTIDLTTQTLILTSPSDLDTTSEMSKVFSWQNLYNADNYRFELSDVSGLSVLSTTTTADSIQHTLTDEGGYSWKVRGENLLTNTIYAERTFYIDTTTPNIPVLAEPDSGAVIDDTNIDFRWSRGTNTGSSITDSMFLATDSDMLNITQTIISTSNIVVLDTLSDGVYYWRVRSIDAAGNLSDYSETHSFTRQQ